VLCVKKGSSAMKLIIRLLCLLCLYSSDSVCVQSRPSSTVDSSSSTTFKAPSTFGKTHFIVGYPHDSATQQSQVSDAPQERGYVKHVLFGPDDNVRPMLLNLINKEPVSIKLTAFVFTDKDIALALIDAHKRGVAVEVVTDPSKLYDRYSKITQLHEKGIEIFVYNPDYKKKSSPYNLMHNKFIVFGENNGSTSSVWTGSFNFTRSAMLRNQENVVVLGGTSVVERFASQFNQLKKRCKKIRKRLFAAGRHQFVAKPRVATRQASRKKQSRRNNTLRNSALA